VAFTACQKATFTFDSGLPGGLADISRFQDLNGGSADTTVFCTTETGENLCTRGTTVNPLDPSGIFTIPNPTQVIPFAGISGQACRTNIFNNTKRTGIKANGIDLWLVVDASQPFDTVRTAVGEAILKGFLENCELGVPLHISVIAAHAPDSIHSSAIGDVFYRHGNEDPTITIYPGMSNANFQDARDNILVKLQRDMHRAREELHSGANEMGLLGLRNALFRTENHPDRALVVIFASDENDPCMSDFNDTHDPDENEMYETYCRPSNITPDSVYAQLRQFAGERPLILSSVVFGPESTFPERANKNPGRGYLDIVERAGGTSVNLERASGQTEQEYIDRMALDLAAVTGHLTTRYSSHYAFYPVTDVSGLRLPLTSLRVVPNTKLYDVQVRVDNVPVGFKLDTVYNLVIPNRSGDVVRIDYCLQ